MKHLENRDRKNMKKKEGRNIGGSKFKLPELKLARSTKRQANSNSNYGNS